jgi:hypothetical protein
LRSRPWFVAAAFVGASIAASVIATLAFASVTRIGATVTLQVAPRGLGEIAVSPADTNGVNTCSNNEQGDSCLLTYQRGQEVTLEASSSASRTLAAWSTPDCPGTGTCSLKLDDDLTSIVALFNPLRLAVILSSPDTGTVTTSPVGPACGGEQPGNADACFTFAPGTVVKVTMKPNAGHTFQGWNPGCEPTDALTCTTTVQDEPTWVGARFDGDEPPQLPTTIDVEFRLKRGGTGSGRISADDIDCGTVCSRQYGYGKSLTLTATPDAQSVFSGWNGVCANTQTTCTVPVGPITSLKAIFDHDAEAPKTPTGVTVTAATRAAISISWTASTDNVSVAGYRLYLNDAAVGNTSDTTFTFPNLTCGGNYTLSVDAVDVVGNRSTRAAIRAKTQPCRLAGRLAGIRVVSRAGQRVVVVSVRVNRGTTASLALLKRNATLARRRYTVAAGTNILRLRAARKLRPGAYIVTASLVNPDGGTLSLGRRTILLPRLR